MKERSGLKKLTFGVAVMSVSVMLSKICGMFFKIPLTAILGTYGMGVFNTAYTVYSLLFVLCSAGLPSAIAISVSSSALECENKASPSRILLISVKFFGTLGLICAVSTYVLADVLAGMLNNPESAGCLRALSLCLFFTTVSGVLRGYFQGHSDMLPTAVSQVIEAIGKLVLGVLFAWYANKNEFPVSTVAAYAVLGVTFSSILGTVYLLIKYVIYKNKHKTFVNCDENRNQTNNLSVLKKLLRTAAPITMSSLVMSIVGIIDLLIVMRLLGGEFDSVNDEYGAYSALATPIFNLPSVMIMPIAASALPIIAGSLSLKDHERIKDTVLYSAKLCMSVAVPSALGLCFLSEPVLALLFEDAAAQKAAPMLSALSCAVVFMCLITLQAPILQGMGMSGMPVASMLVGAISKVLIGLFLVSELGIYACPVGTLVCYGLASIINGYFIECKASIQIPYFRYFFSTLICALPATALALVFFGLTQAYIGMNFACIVAIILCLVVYLALILFSGYFKIRDIVIALHLEGRIKSR